MDSSRSRGGDFALGAMAVFGVWMYLNQAMHVVRLLPCLIGGVLMWICMLKSGIHATVAGVLLAFTIPCATHDDSEASPSHRLEGLLHAPIRSAAAFQVISRPILGKV